MATKKVRAAICLPGIDGWISLSDHSSESGRANKSDGAPAKLVNYILRAPEWPLVARPAARSQIADQLGLSKVSN